MRAGFGLKNIYNVATIMVYYLIVLQVFWPAILSRSGSLDPIPRITYCSVSEHPSFATIAEEKNSNKSQYSEFQSLIVTLVSKMKRKAKTSRRW